MPQYFWRLLAGVVLLSALLGSLWLYLAQDQDAVLKNRSAVTDLEKKIGQLIMVGFNGTSSDDHGVKVISAQLADGKIGGVMLLSRNIESKEQLKRLTHFLRKQAPQAPILIAVDQEGGHVQRLAQLGDGAYWLSAEDLARETDNCDTEMVQAYYQRHASLLPELGINVNFGPVVDLNLNPGNPIIGRKKRSFSRNPETVTRCASGFVAAHQELGVATALKHFPGHGSTLADSHHALPVLDRTWQEQELVPYKALAKSGYVDLVMMGHLAHQQFSDTPDTPASLSRKGTTAARAATDDATVILTDDLEMDAVTDRHSIEDAAVAALAAGNDMILFSSFDRHDPGLGDRLNAALVAAVKDGRLSEAKVDRSAKRIKVLKSRLAQNQ